MTEHEPVAETNKNSANIEYTNINYLWAHCIVEELTRCGVSRFYLSPGSRNSPLVVTAAENEGVQTRLLIDERAAAFLALGYAKATGEPAVLVCTSGTAVANYLPAVVEASLSSVPLIILSADRPVQLRDTGANQTIDQVHLLGSYQQYFFDLPAPSATIPVRSVLTTVDQLVYRARRQPAGPVQLNCQFAEPLAPEPGGAGSAVTPEVLASLDAWRAATEPVTRYADPIQTIADAELATVESWLAASRRGVMIAGRLDGARDDLAIIDLASRLGLPLLTDIGSGLRFGPHDKRPIITHHEYFLKHEPFAREHRPDLILHLGGPLVSRSLQQFVETAGARYIVIDRTPRRQDPGHVVGLRVEMAPGEFCARIGERIASRHDTQPIAASGSGSQLLPAYRRADRLCADVLAEALSAAGLANEQSVLYQVLPLLPPDTGLFLGNSMPVRDAEACGVILDHMVRVGVNRGASGIDGTIASALGFAEGLGRRTVLVLGDLAFLHDLNSLLLLRDATVPVTAVLLNNDGGGIFSFLPIARRTEHFERCFSAAHGLEFSTVVRAFGLEHFSPETPAQLRDAAARAFAAPGSAIIEVRTDRARNLVEHETVRTLVEQALDRRATDRA